MSTEKTQLQKMVDALKEGVAIAIKLPADQQAAALEKNFTEYGAALEGEVAGGIQQAFMDGHSGNLRKFVTGATEALGKDTSFSLVAQIAQALSMLDSAVDYACGCTMGDGKSVLPDNVKQSLEDYITVGEGVLRTLIGAGDVDDYAKMAQAGGLTKMSPEEEKDFRTRLAKMLGKQGDLAKNFPPKKPAAAGAAPAVGADPAAGGAAPGAGGSTDATKTPNAAATGQDDGSQQGDGSQAADGQDDGQMNPIEVIGRLAAAILVQCEAILGNLGDDDGSGAQDTTAGGGASGAATTVDDTAKQAPNGDLAKITTADPAVAALAKSVAEIATQLGTLTAKNTGGSQVAVAAGSAELSATLEKINGDMTTLTSIVQLLAKNTPAGDPKGKTNGLAVDKQGDTATAENATEELTKFATELSKLTPDQQTTKLIGLVHSTGGRKI